MVPNSWSPEFATGARLPSDEKMFVICSGLKFEMNFCPALTSESNIAARPPPAPLAPPVPALENFALIASTTPTAFSRMVNSLSTSLESSSQPK